MLVKEKEKKGVVIPKKENVFQEKERVKKWIFSEI